MTEIYIFYRAFSRNTYRVRLRLDTHALNMPKYTQLAHLFKTKKYIPQDFFSILILTSNNWTLHAVMLLYSLALNIFSRLTCSLSLLTTQWLVYSTFRVTKPSWSVTICAKKGNLQIQWNLYIKAMLGTNKMWSFIHRWSLYTGSIADKVYTWGSVKCGLYKQVVFV